VDTELEALRTLALRVWDLVLDNADGSSSLAASLSMVVQLLEGRANATAANGVHWGTRSALVAALLNFIELEPKLELLGFGRKADLMEDQADALWARVHVASHVHPSIDHNPPDGTGE
jgi:hypothetical protein